MIQLSQHKAKHFLTNHNSLLKSVKFLILENLAQTGQQHSLQTGRWGMLEGPGERVVLEQYSCICVPPVLGLGSRWDSGLEKLG